MWSLRFCLMVWMVTSAGAQLYAYEDYRIMTCNTSRSDQLSVHVLEDIQITNPILREDMLGKPFYCEYEVKAPEGYFIETEIIKVITGHSSWNFTARSCGKKDYLRVWDGLEDSVWKPTEVCGTYTLNSIKVKRVVSGREVKIEYRVREFTEHSGYEVRVRYRKAVISHERIGAHYGGYNDVLGKVSGTLCDWEIEVNKCIGYCSVTSPGYPGIYPPHTSCTYKFINRDGERVELFLAGSTSGGGKFDIKKTHNCEEDQVVVYDGEKKSDPIIGIFCGSNVPEIISTGNALLMEFNAVAGRPPWSYSGFDSRVGHRWRSELATGLPIPNTPCSWEFDSEKFREGQITTPDHMLIDDIQCEYQFRGQVGEIVNIEIVFYQLRDGEMILIIDGAQLLEKIWVNDATPGRNTKLFNSTSHSPKIIYNLEGGQLSNHVPVFMFYEFMKVEPVTSSQTVVDGEPGPNSAVTLTGLQSFFLCVVIVTMKVALLFV